MIGFTAGTFDLLHAGHVLMLEEAAAQCEYLIVGLQSDPTIDRPWKNKPVQSVGERYIQLNAVRYVDQVVEYTTEDDLRALLERVWPDIRIVGDDHRGKQFTGRSLAIPLYYNSRDHGYSTSDLRRRVADG